MTRTRRLAAILAADVAGYSRLMGVDEEGTHERSGFMGVAAKGYGRVSGEQQNAMSGLECVPSSSTPIKRE